MNFDKKISELQVTYDVLSVVDLDQWFTLPIYKREAWLTDLLTNLHRPVYDNNQRLVFTLTKDDSSGTVEKTLRKLIDRVDISDWFVILYVGQREVYPLPKNYKKDSYNSADPLKISVDSLNKNQQHLLKESKTFCMYPWVHIHSYPTGEAWPCCMADMSAGPIGNCRENTLAEIWNGDRMKELRVHMLSDVQDSLCVRCYEQEASGFLSGRQSANKHHGHHIERVLNTQSTGHLDQFEMTYWDLRFSNLCNLKCRSCGHIFSSSWYNDQIKLAGEDWGKQHKPLQIAGRFEGDLFNQLLDHVDHVEQIYFAGGEPLMMEEHYAILDELERRGMFHVRLIYNTNFTKTRLKDREVFDHWRKFDSVSVGASLDAMGDHAEYIRSGTKWKTVEANRRRMMEVCPNVDFYISATLSILNALHLPKFHQAWVEKGLIGPKDFNVNILQNPLHYRIDIASKLYKKLINEAFERHILWLQDQDPLQRATNGFQSAVRFLNATDNSHLIDEFWKKTTELDQIRNECIYDFIPELVDLQK